MERNRAAYWCCGVCAAPQKIDKGIYEVYELIHVGSGVLFYRCRKCMNKPITQKEIALSLHV